ncbi:hypothetical protein DIC82_05255 [Clostridium beijerinckii]|nr:hypothetical protein DIC82_05255 [Clostridium beijerinckii]
MAYSYFSENLKRVRKQKKLTQAALGKIIGKSESTIRKYEAGNVDAPFTTICDISEKLNIPMMDLTEKHYNSEEEVTIDRINTIEYEAFMTVDNNCNDFKHYVHYLVQTRAFKKEFNINYKELSKIEQRDLKRDIYNSIQLICSKKNDISIFDDFSNNNLELSKTLQEGE